jgi:hypothetical protein
MVTVQDVFSIVVPKIAGNHPPDAAEALRPSPAAYGPRGLTGGRTLEAALSGAFTCGIEWSQPAGLLRKE